MRDLFLLATRKSLFFNAIKNICRKEGNVITMTCLVATPIQVVKLHEFQQPKNFRSPYKSSSILETFYRLWTAREVRLNYSNLHTISKGCRQTLHIKAWALASSLESNHPDPKELMASLSADKRGKA
jgi:hypothetical protein